MTDFVIPPACIDIATADQALATYQFDDGTAKHHFCRRCGVFTFVETRLNPGMYRVNIGCIEGVDSFSLPVAVFDGTSI